MTTFSGTSLSIVTWIRDKYIGDAVMALFHGDPKSACACALEIEAQLKRYNQSRLGMKETSLFRWLIHTGTVMLGTVGDNQRLQTTVISDAVNLASRVEGFDQAVCEVYDLLW